LRLNALDRPNHVWVGQRLKVPKQRAEPEPPEPPAAP